MRSFAEAWREILERPDGPFAFRFYLRPVQTVLVAVALALLMPYVLLRGPANRLFRRLARRGAAAH